MLSSFDIQQEQLLAQKLIQRVGFEFFNSDFTAFSRWIAPLKQQVNNLSPQIITIGGSNGKGEVAFTLAHHLQAANKKFSLWTSPHVLTICERFYSDQGHISYSELRELLDEQLHRVQDYSPSYYELLFALFLRWSIRLQVDFIILEVGLGGRLDAVNVLDSDLVAITSISREHTAILGHYYRDILAEKLAVAKTANQLFTTFALRYLVQQTEKFAQQYKTKYRNYWPEGSTYTERNRQLATLLANALAVKVTEGPLYLGRGRQERLSVAGREFLFIGAHNLDGVRELEKCDLGHWDLALIAFSQRSVKEIEQICKIFSKIDELKKIVITAFNHPKAASPEMIAAVCDRLGINFVKNWQDILKEKRAKILVTGSYYFIGEVLCYIHNDFGHSTITSTYLT